MSRNNARNNIYYQPPGPVKDFVKSMARYAFVAYMGFQLGSNAQVCRLKQNYAIIPKAMVEKYGSNFRELVSDVVAISNGASIEDIVFHELDKKVGKTGAEEGLDVKPGDIDKEKSERY